MFKAMIVDDEPLILRGMKRIIDWESYGLQVVSQCLSGEQALEAFLEHPVELVITDIRMSGMSGLQLVETIRSLEPETKFIVLSGYDDFNYVKQGIHFGIENYLLKPVDINELSITIENTVRKLTAAGYIKKKIIEEAHILRTNIMNRWITRTITLAELKLRAELVNIPLHHDSFLVVTGNLVNNDDLEEGIWIEVRNDILAEACHIVRDELKLHLSTLSIIEFIDSDGDLGLLISHPTHEINREQLHTQLLQLIHSIRNRWQVEIILSISDTVPSHLKVPDCYVQAKKIFIERSLKNEQYILEKETKKCKINKSFSSSNLQQLTELLAEHNVNEIEGWIKQAFMSLQHESDISLTDVQNVALDIMMHISKQLRQDSFIEYVTPLLALKRIEQIEVFVIQFFTQQLDNYLDNEKYQSPVVTKVIQHIHQHYSSELSLKTLAHKYHVHPVYLGQLFKKEIGQGFTGYVNQYRIQIAQQLLLETELKANEIGIRIGCLDANYFYKLFTKLTGVSPTDFRAMRYKKVRGSGN